MSVEAAVQSAEPISSARRLLRRPFLRATLQVAVTVLLITYVLGKIDVRSVDFGALHPGWLALAVFTTVPQFLGCALRWRFTARRLGVTIPLGHAMREYYVSSMASQLLPSSLMGDALRVLRHGRALGNARASYGLSLRVVVLERIAGQLVLWSCVLIGAPLWLGYTELGQGFALLVAAVGITLLALRHFAPERWLPAWARARADDAYLALIQGPALTVQVATSLLTIASCVAMFGASAMALGAPLELPALLRIAPLVLASMTLPLSFAGWGVRELATSALYAASGLDPALGAATSIVYGLICLVGSVPGALFALSPDPQE